MDTIGKPSASNHAQNVNKRKRHTKYTLHSLVQVQEMSKAQVLGYIKRLHKLIKKQSKQLKKYKELKKKFKYRDKVSIDDAETAAKKSSDETQATSMPSTKTVIEKRKEAIETKDSHLNSSRHKTAASIVEEIKEAAERTSNQLGFVYEPTSGLYYDCKTGFYYNAEHGLYYDGNTGTYYTYNQDEKKFEFYSQAYADAEPTNTATKTGEDTNNSVTVHATPRDIHKSDTVQRDENTISEANNEDREDGELSGSIDDLNDDDDNDEYNNVDDDDDHKIDIDDQQDEVVQTVDSLECETITSTCTYEDVAKKYPPSLRIIVLETVTPKLRIGELFIITYKGGTLGREGPHDVIIPDINVSKFHLKFSYNEKKAHYECVDLGSRNGTILNGKRLSNAKQESEPAVVMHGSVIQLSFTKLLCHIHDGYTTCGQCEPGLMRVKNPAAFDVLDADSKPASVLHKAEIKRLKKRYGLADQKFLIQQQTKNDRAAKRRKEVGSTAPNEKTAAASLDAAICTDNKGFKMLTKLGWTQGQALGKSQIGIIEPIPLHSNDGTKGLGCDNVPISIDKKTAKKNRQLQITHERYNSKQQQDGDIFQVSDDSN